LARAFGLPPLGAASPRVLVLGSFPSRRSLEKGEYYGHERKHFWPIVGALFDFDSAAPYADRAAALARSGLALWDVIASCERPGSLDKDIRGEEPNAIIGYLAARPSVERIALNGAKAAAAFRALVAPELGRGGLPIGAVAEWRPAELPGRAFLVARLPSTSPIPTRRFRRAEDKMAPWGGFAASIPLHKN
jgi:hypoxanthine-DNA glycosylase